MHPFPNTHKIIRKLAIKSRNYIEYLQNKYVGGNAGAKWFEFFPPKIQVQFVSKKWE